MTDLKIFHFSIITYLNDLSRVIRVLQRIHSKSILLNNIQKRIQKDYNRRDMT